jgi:DeoR/GlpR family transcriptional regulator of sugar metabolism
MDFDPEEAAFARALLRGGRRRVVVSDSRKFGREALVLVCGLAEIDGIVTDAAPPARIGAALDRSGVAVTLAS